MADRQQNINIKFNTNTVDLEKAAQLLNKAKAANDSLNQSINKTGTQGAQAAAQFSNNISGLTLQMQRLKAQIDLANQSDKARLDQLRSQYAAMSAQLAKYQGDVAKTQVAQKSLTDGLGGLYSMVRIALTAGLIAETVKAGIEMAKLKGQVDGVTKAFNNLPNATLLMADLKAKTHGTLDELTLMQKAVQAKNFKIPLEQLGTLLEFAAIKAQQTGLDINYLVNSLITGLGRNSIRLLDNLQISVTELRQKTKELGSTQAAVFAIVNKQMQDMGGFLETDATKVDKLSAAWTNFKINLAERIESGGVLDFFNKVVTGWELLLGGSFRFKMANDEAVKSITAFKKSTDALLDSDKKVQATELEIDKLRIRRLQDGGKLKELQIELNKTSTFLGGAEANKQAQLIEEQIKAISKRNDVTAISIKLLEDYRKSLTAIKPDDEVLGVVEGFNDKVKELNETIEKSTDVSGKEQQEAIEKRKEYERLIAVYTLTKSELDKYIESMDTAKVTSKSFREEIDKQIEAITQKLAKALKPPAKGAIPVGGFTNVDGTPFTPKGDPNSPEAVMHTVYNNYLTFWDKIKLGFTDMNTHIRKEGKQTVEDERRSIAEALQHLVQNMKIAVSMLAANAIESDVRSYDARIAASEAYYNKQVDLLGDNQKQKVLLEKKHNQEITRLERERAEAAKRAALSTIVIQTAVAVVKALATAPNYIVGIIEAAAAGVLGAAQYSVAASAKYAEGVIDLKGPGTGTSDSIPARLSKGESVMTAQETRESMGILKAIRAKKINDGIISEIFAKSGVAQQGYDFTRLEKAIHEMPKPSDLIKQGSLIYEAKEKAKGHRQLVRNKYLG